MDLPWIAPDETIYALLGRSLWETGVPSLLGTSFGGYGLVYPALIGFPLTLSNLGAGVAAAQALGALVMSSTAVAVYLWGRTVVGAWWALAAAGLTLALPELAYSGLLMSEVAVYPTVALALWATAAALARPSRARQALVLGAVVLAVGTHIRSVALIPALFVAVALHCAFVRSFEPARRQTLLLTVTAAACTASLAGFAIAGSWNDVFGAYAAAAGGYELRSAAEGVVWHLAGIFILVAGIPLIALAAMMIECIHRRERDPAACALVATAAAWTVCLVLEVGIFASRWVDHVVLRDLLPVVPPLLLVLVLWTARRLPRPAPLTQLSALVLAVPAVLFPVKQFAVQAAALDAFSIIPLWRLREATSAATLEVVYVLSVSVFICIAVFLPPHLRAALPVAVAVAFVSLSVVSTREIERLTRLDRAWVFDVGDPRWVDQAAEGPVTYLQAGDEVSGWILEARLLESQDHIGCISAGCSACRPGRAHSGRASRRRAAPHGRRRRFGRGLGRVADGDRARRRADRAGAALHRPDRADPLAHQVTCAGELLGLRRATKRGHPGRSPHHGLCVRAWTPRTDPDRQAGHSRRDSCRRHSLRPSRRPIGHRLDR